MFFAAGTMLFAVAFVALTIDFAVLRRPEELPRVLVELLRKLLRPAA
jgi:hypothetical protein